VGLGAFAAQQQRSQQEQIAAVKQEQRRAGLILAWPCFAGQRGTNPPGDWCPAKGCDFGAEAAHATIDFASCHLYPDLWLPNASSAAKLAFSKRWLECHVDLCANLGKPLVLSEFGKKAAGVRVGGLQAAGAPAEAASEGALHAAKGVGGWRSGTARASASSCSVRTAREEFYGTMLADAHELMRAGKHLAGMLFWMIAADSYPDFDGFTVYFGGKREDDGTAAIITGAAAAAAQLNWPHSDWGYNGCPSESDQHTAGHQINTLNQSST
jgi:hypothetical protein